MNRKKNLVFWNIPVPRNLDEAVRKAVISDTYVSKSEFVRDACRKELRRIYELESAKNEQG